ncbi:MAG TPA: histidine kinase [Nocardioidaceae bacterium]|nr:histidine kinase [Nocardioidaceae bacterium]
MHLGRPTRDDAVLAVGTLMWAASLLTGQGPAQLVVPPLAALGVLLLTAHPVPGSLVVATAPLVSWWLGVEPESAAALLPVLLATYALGRRCSTVSGLAGVAALATALLVRDPTWPNLAFAAFVLGGAWGFGRLVQHRTEAAALATAQAVRLHETDPGQVAADVVAEERACLADETVGVVRDAVEQMRRSAQAADPTLDPDRIAAIQVRGRAAVAELRRLLGLLREDPATPEVEETALPPRVRRADVATAVLIAAVVVAEGMLTSWPGGSSLGIALGAALCAGLALRRSHTALACLVAAAPTAVALVAEVPLARGFAELLTIALLSWTVGGCLNRRAWEAWTLLSVLALAAVAQEAPDNLAITAAVFALPAFAGRAWGEHGRLEQAADRSAEGLRRHIDARVAEAVTRERLRIARELHDVASHAVGVMVLQAGAAAAQRDTDPAAARAALAVVLSSGADALAELAVLRDVLRAGALGTSATLPALATELAQSLAGLAERMQASGLDVVVDLDSTALPDDPSLRATVYRVAQETLTNAAKHAPGARVVVAVRREEDEIVVEVVDDGNCGGEPGDAGFGLVGLAERVRDQGGEISTGPRTGGGFAVLARLPLRTPMTGEAIS